MTYEEEEQKNLAEYEAEAMWVTGNYQPLIDLQEEVERRNQAYKEQCRVIMKELEQENAGDC